jgi:ketosteroid isomerase-like protein
MKFLLGVALLTLALTGVAPAEAGQKPSNSKKQSAGETLVALEKQVWALIKRRDLKALAGRMAEDYYEVFPEGDAHTKAEVLKFFEEEFVLKDYSLHGFRVVMLGKDAGLVVYKADVKGVNKGSDEAECQTGLLNFLLL